MYSVYFRTYVLIYFFSFKRCLLECKLANLCSHTMKLISGADLETQIYVIVKEPLRIQ